MLKEYLWDAFANTGNIDAYILYKQLENNNQNNSSKEAQITKEEVAVSS